MENNWNEKGLTGYPSIDKPWLKYYSEEAINAPLPECTIYEYLWENNKEHLDDIALIYFGKKITYKELFENIDKAAKSLIAIGVSPGDIVTIAMPSIPESLYSVLAVNRIGAIANMIHPLAGEKEICYYLNEVKSKYFFMFDGTYDIISRSLNTTHVEKAIVVSAINSLPILYKIKLHKKRFQNNFMKWSDFIEIGKKIKLPNLISNYKSIAIISHTGGTTGEPKGVVLTNYNIISEIWQIGCNLFHKRQECMLVVLPPFVNYNLVNSMLEPLSFGFKVALIPKYNPDLFDKYINKYHPNHINSIPAYWEALLTNDRIKKTDLSCLKYITYGGEAMIPEKEIAINKLLQSCGSKNKLIKGLGSTEMTSCATITYDDCNYVGSAGVPLVKCNCKIVEPESELELEYNQEGEICFSGPTLMVGYYENINATNDIIKMHRDGERWIHTGDLGYITSDGIVYVTGRIKRIILTKGEDGMVTKIFPIRIEKVISNHPAVSFCCIVGIPDDTQINRPYAIIVLKEKMHSYKKITEEIIYTCISNLPKYMIPKLSDFKYIDTIPRTTRGKIDYRALEKLAEEEVNGK